jgi:transcriptional regulator with XRE-family HTH domain
MARINPFVLQKLRRDKGWPQERLAEMAKVNKQTISRIERGEQKNTRGVTIKRLAGALGVEPDELTRSTVTAEANESGPVRRARRSGFGISDPANNFLYLISERYFIKPWQVMELAPLLFCWAAEMSLRDRRERLNKFEEACKTARGLEDEMHHLPHADFEASEKKIAAEASSIHSHDIFGMCFGDDDFSDGAFYPPQDDTDNPFAVFLAKLADDIGDVARFEGFSPIDYPVFQVCREEALRMVGDDETLAERILTGIVDLYDMPKELHGVFGKTDDRAAWVRAQADAYIARVMESVERRKKAKEATP